MSLGLGITINKIIAIVKTYISSYLKADDEGVNKNLVSSDSFTLIAKKEA